MQRPVEDNESQQPVDNSSGNEPTLSIELDDDIISQLSEESRAEFEAMRPQPEASEEETSDKEQQPEQEEAKPQQQRRTRSRAADPRQEADKLLEGLTIEQVLQHPTLAPQLQSWKDRTSYAEREAARRQWEQEAQDRAIEQAFASMSNDQLLEYIDTTPGGKERYAEFVMKQRAERENVENQQAVLIAKTIAIGERLQETMEEMKEVGIDAAGDLDPNAYVEQGEYGFIEWRKKAQEAVRRAHAQRIYETELRDKEAIGREEQLADRDAGRRPAILSNGRVASPDRIDFDNITAEELADRLAKDPSIRKQYSQIR